MMLLKRVLPKQITTVVKEGKTRGRLLLWKSSVTRFKLNNTSRTNRKHQTSKNSRIPGEKEARSLLDVGTPNKHQVTTGECFFSQHQPFEIETTRSSEMKKPVRPSRLLSTPTHKDLKSRRRKSVFETNKSKKLQIFSGTELVKRDETSNMPADEDKHDYKDNTFTENFSPRSSEDKHDYKDNIFTENFSLRSSSLHQQPFIFSSPHQSQIMKSYQIMASPPGAPKKALFRKESTSHVPSPLNLRKQAHLSASELDDTSMEKESADSDESNFVLMCRKLEF